MLLRISTLFVAVLVAILSASWFLLQKEPAHQVAFYYWRTQWNAPEVPSEKLYLRFFDVKPELGQPVPVSPLQLSKKLPVNIAVTPVVYLTNSVFFESTPAHAEALAEKVFDKVNAMAKHHAIEFKELQIDCDWSDSTRARYFHFANQLRARLHSSGKTLSATLRLHQIKYSKRTGVPPIDRGMLMFYNFGRLEAEREGSSIFNAQDAKKYSSYIATYPLPLDLSLPLFSWAVHSRAGSVIGLLEKTRADEIETFDGFMRIADSKFEAKRAFFFNGRFFEPGDRLVIESTKPEDTLEAARLAHEGAGSNSKYGTIAFFDLDERNLRNYAASNFEEILSVFD